MRAGNIIEFFDDGDLLLGYITQVESIKSGSKTRENFKVLTEKNKITNITESKIINCENCTRITKYNQDEVLALLKELKAKRIALVNEIKLNEIWELLCLENKEYWSPAEIACAYFGDSSNNDLISALVRSLYTKTPYFKKKNDYFTLTDAGEVQKYFESKDKERKAAEENAAFLNNTGALFQKAFAPEAVSEFLAKYADRVEKIKNSFVFPENNSYSSFVKELQSGLYEACNIKLDPFKFLIKLGCFGENENFLLIKYGIKKEFSQGIIAEACELKNSEFISKYNESPFEQFLDELRSSKKRKFKDLERIDMTGIPTYTIDGERTVCCDDALSFKAYSNHSAFLAIHISDISEEITGSGKLDREAHQRATAIYMAEGKIDIFPDEISNVLFSLKEKEKRLTLSLAVWIENMEIVNWAFVPVIINVDRKCSYTEINEILKKFDDNFVETSDLNGIVDERLKFKAFELKMIREFFAGLRKKREEAGALNLFFPKLEMHAEKMEDGTYKITAEYEPDRESNNIVSESMILYNNMAANFLNENLVPAVFKSSKPFAAPELLSEYRAIAAEKGYDPVSAFKIKRSFPFVETDYKMNAYGLLGVNGYVQASSPVRRYMDIIIQRQIKSAVIYGKPAYSEEDIKQLQLYCENSLQAASEVEQESYYYWLYKYFDSISGSETGGTVVETYDDRARIELEKYYIHIIAPERVWGSFNIGQKVKVIIEGAEPRLRKLNFSIIKNAVNNAD